MSVCTSAEKLFVIQQEIESKMARAWVPLPSISQPPQRFIVFQACWSNKVECLTLPSYPKHSTFSPSFPLAREKNGRITTCRSVDRIRILFKNSGSTFV
jgi:hypothetical protein